jgi:hypothetical protein
MIIHLNPEWRIKSDPQQWIVQQGRTANCKQKWDSLSFHHSLDGAVLWVAQRRVRLLEGVYGPDALPHLCQTLDSLKSEILSAINKAAAERESHAYDQDSSA